MAWREVEKPAFADALQGLPGTMGEIIAGLYLPMIEYDDDLRCIVRDADHNPKDLPPPGYSAYLIHGDLDVETAISLSHLNDPEADGNMIFIVTGNLTAPRFVTEWGSVVLVGGDLTIRELMFAAREDSAHFILGVIEIWAFIGRDIWLEFETGQTVEIAYGVGYALRRQRGAQITESDIVRPAASEAESLATLGLSDREALNQLDMDLYGDVPPLR